MLADHGLVALSCDAIHRPSPPLPLLFLDPVDAPGQNGEPFHHNRGHNSTAYDMVVKDNANGCHTLLYKSSSQPTSNKGSSGRDIFLSVSCFSYSFANKSVAFGLSLLILSLFMKTSILYFSVDIRCVQNSNHLKEIALLNVFSKLVENSKQLCPKQFRCRQSRGPNQIFEHRTSFISLFRNQELFI